MDYSPDMIVVNVDMSDDFDDWKYSQTIVRDHEGNPLYAPPRNIYDSAFVDTEVGAIRSTFWLKIQLFLMQHSYAYNLIERTRVDLFGKKSNTSIASEIAPGVDTRAEGGYVVAPPSLHISGERYRWEEEL